MVRSIAAGLFAVTLFALSIWYIAVRFDWREIISILGHANLVVLLVGGTSTLLAYLIVRAIRWWYLLRLVGIGVPFREIYLSSAISIGLAHVTPFQVGEMAKVELVKRNSNLARVPGYGSFVIERVADLCVVSVAALVSIVSLRHNLGVGDQLVFAASTLLAGVLVGGLALRSFGKAAWLDRSVRLLGTSLANVRGVAATTGLTVVGWGMIALGWQFCLLTVGVDIGFSRAAALTSVVTLGNVLSLIPGGVGVSEVGISEFLIRLDVAPGSAQAAALVVRAYGLLMILLGVLHLPFWLRCTRRVVTGRIRDAGS